MYLKLIAFAIIAPFKSSFYYNLFWYVTNRLDDQRRKQRESTCWKQSEKRLLMSTGNRPVRNHFDANGNLKPLLTGKGSSRASSANSNSRLSFERKSSVPTSEKSNLTSHRDVASIRSSSSFGSRPNSASRRSRKDLSLLGEKKNPLFIPPKGKIDLNAITPEYIHNFWSKVQKETDAFHSHKRMVSQEHSRNDSNPTKSVLSNGSTSNKQSVQASVATRKPLLRRAKAPAATPKTPPVDVVASVAVPMKSSVSTAKTVPVPTRNSGNVPALRTSSHLDSKLVRPKPVVRSKVTEPLCRDPSTKSIISQNQKPKLPPKPLSTRNPPEKKSPLVRAGSLKKEPIKSTVPTSARMKSPCTKTSVKAPTSRKYQSHSGKHSPSARSSSNHTSPIIGDRLQHEKLRPSVLNHTVGGLIHPITPKHVKVPFYKPLRNIDGTIIKENGHCL